MAKISFILMLLCAAAPLLFAILGSSLWLLGKDKLFKKVRAFFIGWGVLFGVSFLVAQMIYIIIDDNNLKKAVEETKTRETFLVENSVPLYLQEGIDDKIIDFRLYHYYDIEISEDGTYATLIPRNEKE